MYIGVNFFREARPAPISSKRSSFAATLHVDSRRWVLSFTGKRQAAMRSGTTQQLNITPWTVLLV